jgi:sodium-dependent phosphate transporter
MLDAYTYVFVIGTLFALLDAYNNGASEFPQTLSPSAAMQLAI